MVGKPPLPPAKFDNFDAFLKDARERPNDWHIYLCTAYDFIEDATQELAEITALRNHNAHLQAQNAELQEQVILEKGARRVWENQATKWQNECMEKAEELGKVRSLTMPTVNTPQSSVLSVAPAKKAEVASVGASETPTTPSAAATRISERQPDPSCFTGQRSDLRRFTNQIQQKMTVNRDRFPTPMSRMAYVTGRLEGTPYDQILPYFKDGMCQLKDYHEILEILERAFGDPNLVNNARAELIKLRQTNKEFSAFFAEFQRLALEGRMHEDGLPTLLEAAINRELRGMLMHNEPPSYEYHQFAQHLQKLENRRRRFENAPSLPVPRTFNYSTTSKSTSRQTAPKAAEPALIPQAAAIPTTTVTAPPATAPGEPMDLSTTRRFGPNRKENRLCYRCGAGDHMVRNCPSPDRRLNVSAAHPRPASPTESDYRVPTSESARPFSPESENGAPLA
jgi:hypothetical protein